MKRVFKDRAGNAGVLVVERDEGIPGHDGPYFQRERRVGKADLGQRDTRRLKIAFSKRGNPSKPPRRNPWPCNPWSKILNGGKGPSTSLVTRVSPFI